MLRGGIIDKVCFSMGSKMQHCEMDVDPATGCVHVDLELKPSLMNPRKEPHMPGQHAYDPLCTEMKVHDCISMHQYCMIPDTQTGRISPLFCSEQILDLPRLMEQSIKVKTARVCVV